MQQTQSFVHTPGRSGQALSRSRNCVMPMPVPQRCKVHTNVVITCFVVFVFVCSSIFSADGLCSVGATQHEAQTGLRDLLVVRSTQGRREEKRGLQVRCGDCAWDRLGLVCVLRMEEHEAPPPPAVLNLVMSRLPCRRRCDPELHQRTHTRTHMHTQIKPHHSHRAGWRGLCCLTEHYTH